jgi:hypothetical protein
MASLYRVCRILIDKGQRLLIPLLAVLLLVSTGTALVDNVLQFQDFLRRHRIAAVGPTMRMVPPAFSPFMEKKIPEGSTAPEFALRAVVSGNQVKLADFREKKLVVLIFSSFG